jgi:hypothetical protein
VSAPEFAFRLALAAVAGSVVIGVLASPPAASDGDVSRVAPYVVLLASLIGGAAVLLAVQTRRWWWVPALVFAAMTAGGVGFYEVYRERWTCEYYGSRILVGPDSELTDHARRHKQANPGITCQTLLKDYVGEVEEIWSRDSIERRRSMLRVAHASIPALAALVLLLGSQAVRTSPAIEPAADRRAAKMRARLRIFISYRRQESDVLAGRLRARLAEFFDEKHIFLDVYSIPAGADYEAAIWTALDACDVCLVIIGPQWLEARNATGRRLDDPKDLTRREIARALERQVLIVPLLHKTLMPAATELPEPLVKLERQQAVVLRADPDFDADVAKLVDEISARAT